MARDVNTSNRSHCDQQMAVQKCQEGPVKVFQQAMRSVYETLATFQGSNWRPDTMHLCAMFLYTIFSTIGH